VVARHLQNVKNVVLEPNRHVKILNADPAGFEPG
jgi:hypothetical protein